MQYEGTSRLRHDCFYLFWWHAESAHRRFEFYSVGCKGVLVAVMVAVAFWNGKGVSSFLFVSYRWCFQYRIQWELQQTLKLSETLRLRLVS
eukprot:scaffold11799_cov73-Skeletonema_marinoi.AAC.1